METIQRRQVCIWVTLLTVALAGPVVAEDTRHKIYLQYCSACHGDAGKGDGIVSGFMDPKPSDLTQIAKKAGGKFPFYDVVRIIDGRQTMRAHGDPGMPVWGPIFRAEQGASNYAEAAARGKLMMITEYLESIQAK